MIEPLTTLSGRGGFRATRENNWAQRTKWPADDPEYVFMGFAIDRVGRALFGDAWKGTEPLGSPNYPPPLPPLSEASDSLRANVAMSLPRTRQHFRKGEVISYSKGDAIPELTEDEWLEAGAERAAQRESNAASRERWAGVIEAMDWPLRRQEIDTYARRKDSTYFAQAEDKTWSIDDMEGRFFSLRLNPRAPADMHSNDRGWIFFQRESFDAFLRRLQGIPAPRTSMPFVFDRNAETLALYDAIIWTATGGKDTTTGDIADQDLDEAGAQVLFPLLSGANAPLVTGLSKEGLRCDVPREYWELAHTFSLGFNDNGHVVHFVARRNGIDAELTPYRHTKPKWTSLRIARADLEKLIPKPKAAEAKNLVPEQRAFEAWFEAHVTASPYIRTLTLNADIKPWLEKNAPTLSTRVYREVRKIVLSRHKGHGWGKDG